MSATLTPTGHRLVTNCGICDSTALERVLSLGSSPPPCVMTPIGQRTVEEHYPLELLRCRECTLVQLSVVVNPEVVFAPDFPYSSGNSAALHKNFEDLAQQASAWLDTDDLVVDIGANDGTLLSKFHCRKVGVEPTAQADRIDGNTYRAFFSEEVALRILADHGPAKVITACNVLAHVEDVNDVMRGISLLLADDGVLIAENHDLRSVVVEGQWDMVYHEHLRFYSPHSFSRLLDAHGLGIKWWRQTKTHGGSFRTFASRYATTQLWPDTDYDFAGLTRKAELVRAYVRGENGDRGRFMGIGATARGTTIINYCGLDVQDVQCVCEVPQSDKIGHYIPGTSIPVVDEEILFGPDARPGLLLSWHMADLIVPKLRARGYTQPILVPLPTPHYV